MLFVAAFFASAFATFAAEGNDSELTYTRMLTISLQNGMAVSPEGAVDADLDGGGIETDEMTGRQFWKLAEDDSIVFSFDLPEGVKPEGVKTVVAEIRCVSNADVKGKAAVRWNSQSRDESGRNLIVEFAGISNFLEKLSMSSAREKNNTLRIRATDGTVGIQGVIFIYSISRPSWNFNGLIITQTAPTPGIALGGAPITVRWTTQGFPEGGWLKLEYRTRHSEWQAVPGFEGITYGVGKGWDSSDGEFEWKEPPGTDTWELRFIYTRNEDRPNPVDVRAGEIRRRGEIEVKTLTELANTKWGFLRNAKGMIPRTWRTLAQENHLTANRIEGRLEDAFDADPETFKKNLDHTVNLLDQLDVLYYQAMIAILERAATLEDKRERDDILDKAEDFIALREITYYRARDRYGDDEETRQYLPRFFQRERKETLEKLLEKIREEADFAERAKVFENVREEVLWDKDVLMVDSCIPATGKILIAYNEWIDRSVGRRYLLTSIRDVGAGEDIYEIMPTLGSSREYQSISFTPNGTYAVLYERINDGDEEQRRRYQYVVWDNSKRQLKTKFEKSGVEELSTHSSWSPRDRYFAVRWSVSSKDIFLYDVSNGQEKVLTMESVPHVMAFSHDEKMIVTRISEDSRANTVVIWNTDSGTEIQKISAQKSIPAVAFSSDSKILAVASDGEVQLWEIGGQRPFHTVKYPGDNYWAAFSMAFTSGNSILALNDVHGFCFIDINTGNLVDIRSSSGVDKFAIVPGGDFAVFSGSNRPGCNIIDVKTGRLIITLGLNDKENDYHTLLHISPDGKSIVTSRWKRNEHRWQIWSLHRWTFGVKPSSP